jgi:hypothetical protein
MVVVSDSVEDEPTIQDSVYAAEEWSPQSYLVEPVAVVHEATILHGIFAVEVDSFGRFGVESQGVQFEVALRYT